MFGPTREEVAEDWRRLHSEELHDFYASQNIIRVIKSRRMRWTGHVVRMVDEKCIQYFDWETGKKRPLGRPTRRWEDNIRMELREVG
jgi:hypothetical protein